MKTCNTCNETKPLDLFHKRGDSNKHRTKCKACTNKQTLEKYHGCADVKRQHHMASRKHSLKKNYGITLEFYDKMLSDQGGTCAICGCTPDAGFLCVDHCHTTGAVRGLLCSPCNRGLGHFVDSTKSLSSAIDYLERSKA